MTFAKNRLVWKQIPHNITLQSKAWKNLKNVLLKKLRSLWIELFQSLVVLLKSRGSVVQTIPKCLPLLKTKSSRQRWLDIVWSNMFFPVLWQMQFPEAAGINFKVYIINRSDSLCIISMQIFYKDVIRAIVYQIKSQKWSDQIQTQWSNTKSD